MSTLEGPDRSYRRSRPLVCDLDREAVKSTILSVHLSGSEAQRAQALADLELIAQADRRVPASLTGFLDEEAGRRWFDGRLQLIQNRAEAHGYASRLFWTKSDGTKAYELLTRLVDALGKPDPLRPLPDEEPADQPRLAHQRAVVTACRRFSRLLKPCCETAFFWNRATDRTDFLYARNLRFPEAVTGIVWGDAVPRRALFEEEGAPQSEGVQIWRGGSPWTTSGSFRQREGIVLAWVIRLQWEGSRLALFLNWRQDPPPHDLEPRDLRPALRYLAGWLATSGAVLVGNTPRAGRQPMTLIADVGQVLTHDRTPEHMGDLLGRVVRAALRLEARAHYAVHWVEEDADKDGRPRRWLRLAPDRYGGFDDPSPRLSLDVPQDQPVQKSTAVQCAVWGASLRIPSLDAPLNRRQPRGPEVPVRTWRTIDVSREPKRDRGKAVEWTSRSQLVVPIKQGNAVTGVINVEHPEVDGLTVAHEMCVELIAHLFARLAEARDATGGGEGWHFLTEQFANATLPASGANLLTNFCEWASEVTDANVVVAHGSDRVSSIFRPIAIHFDEQFRSAEIGRYHQLLRRTRGGPTASRVKELAGDKELAPIIDQVLRDAIFGQSTPRRRGRTYRVLVQRRPDPIWDLKSPGEGPRPPAWTLERFASSVGLPLTGDVTVQPEAAIWLHWIRQPVEFVHTGLKARLPGTPKPGRDPNERLLAAVQATIGPVLGAVAAMYAVFKFLSPLDEGR